ncbi:terpene synthase family protein [Streptomyces smaragdinus]|uniref:terpene synthase family protein n=1 Tax=Streptomyces smaragdinus TaxID=2585196 RepID=UPI001294D8EF|nr:hypothetical protein [Streptomyces smaragdinus]
MEPLVTAWAQKVGLLSAEAAEQARRERHIAFAGRVWPWAPPERLAELSRLALWMFAVDDRSDARGDDSGEVDTELQAMMRIVTCAQEAVPEQAPASVRVLAEVVPRLTDRMSPAWGVRLRRHLAEWIYTNRDMIRRRAESSVPTPRNYIAWRRVSGAVGWCFDLTEYAHDAELTELVWSSPACRRVRDSAADIICWTNDLYSLAKELRTGETSNLVVVLQHHHHLTLRDAVSEVHRRLSLRITELPAAIVSLRTTASAMNLTMLERGAVDRYVDGIRAWARGFINYSQESARYADSLVPLKAAGLRL